MFNTIENEYSKNTLDLLKSKDMQVISLESNSLLSKENPKPFLTKVRKTCEEVSMKCSLEWKDKNKSYVDKIIKNQKEKEKKERLELERQRNRKNNNILILLISIGVVVFLIVMASGFLGGPKNDTSPQASKMESVIAGKKLYGTVGDYQITMELQIEESKVKGLLYYNSLGPDNMLNLSGVMNKNEIKLDEINKNGELIGSFSGNYSNGIIQGEFTTSKGKSIPFKVSEQQ